MFLAAAATMLFLAVPPILAIGSAAITSAVAIWSAWILRNEPDWIKGRDDRLRPWLLFVVSSGLIAPGVNALLGAPARHGVCDPRVRDYLAGAASADERALRRFQLADRLARVYSQYLVYRGDWLLAWEAGKHVFATAQRPDPALRALEAECLAPLWQAVAGALGEHRARLVQALVAGLQAEAGQRAPLHVFGLSHLPPAELSVLRAYARRAPVFLYAPDPCREYWGGLQRATGQGDWRKPDVSGWQAFRDDEQARFDDPDALDWREQGHPLLARWGRLGQHLFAALVDDELREDIRHWRDAGDAAPGNRLERLQESIRRLQPELMREDAADPAAAADASLRVHACHTRLRELEVLRDALLDAVGKEGMRPGDIAVMAPDIQAYLPLIPAVFGEPGSARERLLPYHLADVPVARSHRLFAVFATLLGLGASRITAPEVVDLLGVVEVRAALGLDAGDAEILVEWLRNSRVAWALDAAHKQALALPARAEHSFAWAMDRLLAGYLMADVPGGIDPPPVTLPDGTALLPLAGIEGPSAAALGSLDRLLCELQAWRDLAQIEQARAAGPVDVDILLPGETAPVQKGQLTFIDNTIDHSTGTITARATIGNAKFALLPGQYVRVRLHIKQQPDALMVPQTALGSSQLGKYLYVLGKGNTVDQRIVSLGPTNGDQVAILSGVSEGDQIITGNLQKIGPGMPVSPLPQKPAT